ncbi:MAG: cobalamin-binding protein [Pyrinomonadaceae bacterium]
MNNGRSPKIVSLLPSATEIVCALGFEENLAGITHECDFPPSVVNKPQLTSSLISHEKMTSRDIDHAVRTNLDGHGSIYELDQELLRQINPDLIITQELCEVCAVSYQTVQKAARMYVAEARVISLEPNTIGDIFQNIKTVGDLCGIAERAEALTDDLQNRLNKVKKQLGDSIKRPDVFMLEWLEPPFAPGHWTPEQVEIAGGNALLGETGKKSTTVTYQTIVSCSPEVLVLIPCGYYIDDILRQLTKTKFPRIFSEMPAFINERIWAMDASAYFSRPGPRVVDGVEILAKIFHPDIFGGPRKSEAVRISPGLFLFED